MLKKDRENSYLLYFQLTLEEITLDKRTQKGCTWLSEDE